MTADYVILCFLLTRLCIPPDVTVLTRPKLKRKSIENREFLAGSPGSAGTRVAAIADCARTDYAKG